MRSRKGILLIMRGIKGPAAGNRRGGWGGKIGKDSQRWRGCQSNGIILLSVRHTLLTSNPPHCWGKSHGGEKWISPFELHYELHGAGEANTQNENRGENPATLRKKSKP